MNKNETRKLTNLIKGYYNSEFFIDDYVLEAWFKTLEPYDYQDAEEHIKTYLKEFPELPPKPHTFIKGLLTHEEKIALRNSKYTIQCNLCGRWMSLEQYDVHYGRCLDIEYLESVAKQKGEKFRRVDLEEYRQEVIDRLLAKYPPKQKEFMEVL